MLDDKQDEPVLGAPANARLIETYERYSQTQVAILQVLSIVYQPINQTALQKILGRLGWRAPDGTRQAEIMAKPLREQFLADGLVTYEKHLLQCHPDIVEVGTDQMRILLLYTCNRDRCPELRGSRRGPEPKERLGA